MVDDLVVAAELRVLAGQRVEAVRAGRDDASVGAGLVEGLDVLLRQHLEHELVAEPPRRVAGAGLGRRRGRRTSTPAMCSSSANARVVFFARSSSAPGAADPEQVVDLAEVLDACRRAPAPRSPGPGSSPAGPGRSCPTGCPCSRGSSASCRPRTGTTTRPAPGSGACPGCGRRARCRPGTARRTRRRWCTTTARPGRSRRPARRCRPAAGRPAAARASGAGRSPTPVRRDGASDSGARRSRSRLPASAGAGRSAVRLASRAGALANRWSRRSMITSLGDSGLPVFQAGHWSWQRPHSVQVAKSSMPFQVKSSTLPRPNPCPRPARRGSRSRSACRRP